MANSIGTFLISQSYKGKDVISLDQFAQKDLQILFQKARRLKTNTNRAGNLLKGNIVTLLFFEPSTRTFSSFSVAAKRLGAQTLELTDPMKVSSFVKGETLDDAIKTLNAYSDLLIIRHPLKGSLEKVALASDVPVISAGDGVGEHPTQALLDLFTIQEKAGRLENLVGLMTGDMLNGRTVHSLIRGLSKFKGNSIYLLSPRELRLDKKDFEDFAKRGIKITEIFDEKDIPRNADFWYWTRVQKERFKNLKGYNRIKNKFVLKKQIIDKHAGKKTIFMHPLPRVGEILEEVDSDPRALYLKDQLKNGLYVRMALLSLILGDK